MQEDLCSIQDGTYFGVVRVALSIGRTDHFHGPAKVGLEVQHCVALAGSREGSGKGCRIDPNLAVSCVAAISGVYCVNWLPQRRKVWKPHPDNGAGRVAGS